MTKFKSHPSRVRGLKFISKTWMQDLSEVAPFTGAWIEIRGDGRIGAKTTGRTLHGCVD